VDIEARAGAAAAAADVLVLVMVMGGWQPAMERVQNARGRGFGQEGRVQGVFMGALGVLGWWSVAAGIAVCAVARALLHKCVHARQSLVSF
jgi:hypothetical protein